MTTETLFGHLSVTFTPQKENLATEALAFILRRSAIARQTLVQIVGQAVVALPDSLSFRTQVGGQDGDRPDICGTDNNGQERLLIEAKFWAGLTTNQPNTYLDHFKSDDHCLLLFIVPEKRLNSLWLELLRVCREKAHPPQECPTQPNWRKAQLSSKRFLAMTSWRVILQAVEGAVSPSEAEDVRQLRGLCDRMDTDAFLPLCAVDMSPEIPRLIIQLSLLVDDVVTKICESGVADKEHLRHGRSATNYSQYIRLAKSVCASLRIDYKQWASKGQTPLWLVLAGTDWGGANVNKCVESLNKCKSADQPWFFVENKKVRIPILLPLGVEREHVLEAAVKTLTDIAELLKTVTPAA